MQKLRVLVTGEHADLESRVPREWKAGNAELEWVSVPVLEFERLPVDSQLLEDVVNRPRDWILFASPRAVLFWNEALLDAGLDFPVETQVACIGEQTAECANRDGFTSDFYPTEPGSEAFLEEFEFLLSNNAEKPSVIIPRAEDGRTLIADRLTEIGCKVEVIPLYRSRASSTLAERCSQAEINSCRAIVFTSPSSVDAFCKHFEIPEGSCVAALGSYTSQRLDQLGLKHKILPRGDFHYIGDIL